MIRRIIDSIPDESQIARRRELRGALAVIGIFLGILVLVIFAQAKMADDVESPGRPDQASAAAPQATGLAEPSTRPDTDSTTPSAPFSPQRSATAPPRAHTVARGETLAGIALRHDVPFEQIAADNRIADPNRVRAGSRLALNPRPPGVVVIQPGTTLSGHARQCRCTVTQLMALNPHLRDPNRITAGGGLRMPDR